MIATSALLTGTGIFSRAGISDSVWLSFMSTVLVGDARGFGVTGATLCATGLGVSALEKTEILLGLELEGTGVVAWVLARSTRARWSLLSRMWLLYAPKSLKTFPLHTVHTLCCWALSRWDGLSRTCCFNADSLLNFWLLQTAQSTAAGGMMI